MNEKICAITGANGYVGSVVARWFADRGWKVFALTRGESTGPYPQIPFSLGSTLEPKVLEANGITTLIHCAYDFRPVDWSSIRRTNVEGSMRLLQSAKQGGVRKIIFISSISAFAGCASLYGKAKLEIESVVNRMGGTIVRPGLIYGNTVSGGMFGALRSQVLTRKVIPLLGSGVYPQYLLHEDDLCLLLEYIADDRLSLTEGPLVAASSRPWPLKTLLLHLAQQEHKQIRFIRVPWHLVWASIKCLEALGLHPKFRSDSIISLVRQDPSPAFATEANVGFSFRSLA
jgi:nucleoside-diphosphate-sugar epimerase